MRQVSTTVVALSVWAASALAAPPARSTRGGAVPFPGADPEWARRRPEEVGLDTARLNEAIAFAVASESKAPRDLALDHAQSFFKEPFNEAIGPFRERGPATGVVIRRGYLVAEWGEPRRVDMTFSVSKSFVSAVAGLAFDRGLIKDVTRPVYEDVPIAEFASAHNRTVSWEHLLRQTSDWEGTLFGKPDWADRPDGDPATWTTRKRNPPGDVYEYNDVRVNALCLALTHLWRRPLAQVLRDELMEPIGSSRTWRWLGYDNSWINLDGVMVQVVSGGGHWGGGMQISAYDQARFGYLTLNRGRWRDRVVLSEAWMGKSLTPTPAQPTYGFMNYFLNTGGKPLPSAPEGAFWHLGAGNNVIYVDAVNDLVVVARWIQGTALDGLVQRVLHAIQPSDSAARPRPSWPDRQSARRWGGG